MTREEAVIILDGFKHNPLFNEQHFEALDMAISALSENRGEWLLYGYVSTKQIENCTERYCCSKCHNIISRDFRYFKYCPNCGADMRGE